MDSMAAKLAEFAQKVADFAQKVKIANREDSKGGR
jgi:hypothetical protein